MNISAGPRQMAPFRLNNRWAPECEGATMPTRRRTAGGCAAERGARQQEQKRKCGWSHAKRKTSRTLCVDLSKSETNAHVKTHSLTWDLHSSIFSTLNVFTIIFEPILFFEKSRRLDESFFNI
jgi:hypothetical protein